MFPLFAFLPFHHLWKCDSPFPFRCCLPEIWVMKTVILNCSLLEPLLADSALSSQNTLCFFSNFIVSMEWLFYIISLPCCPAPLSSPPPIFLILLLPATEPSDTTVMKDCSVGFKFHWKCVFLLFYIYFISCIIKYI